MIPKILHYIWLGGKEPPEFIEQCLDSWEVMCPDYEIVEWSERNYDINRFGWTKHWYDLGVYAAVADQMRFDILNTYGGIYLDTDIEILKRDGWDRLLGYPVLMAYETASDIIHAKRIGSAVIGGFEGHDLFRNIVDSYERLSRKRLVTSPTMLSQELGNHPKNLISPHDIFSPMTWEQFDENHNKKRSSVVKEDYITERSLAFHWYAASWHGWKAKYKAKQRSER